MKDIFLWIEKIQKSHFMSKKNFYNNNTVEYDIHSYTPIRSFYFFDTAFWQSVGVQQSYSKVL
jgi:hypothetical protein